jgi:hypothetical protein
MRNAIACLMLAVALCGTAAAQPSAVANVAEAASSEAQTALELALERLGVSDGAGALEPARRALALAEAGSTNVDPAFAGFVLARAEFAAGLGAVRQSASLTAPTLSRLPPDEIYLPASQLGASAFAAGNYATSEQAWAAAAAYPSGASGGAEYGRGMALTLQAASIYYAEIGDRGRLAMDESRAQDAYQLAGDAIRLLWPISRVLELEGEVTPEIRGLAQAVAVRTIIRTTLRQHGQVMPVDQEAQGDAAGYVALAGPASLSAPVCSGTLRRPRIRFPYEAFAQRHFGAVAMLVRLENGRAVGSEAVASIGDPAFAEEVRRADWSAEPYLERSPEAPPNCWMPSTIVVPVSFIITQR